MRNKMRLRMPRWKEEMKKDAARRDQRNRCKWEVKEEEKKRRSIETYPALLLSSSQPLDWPGLGWALLPHWGRVTQNHPPTERKRGRGGREKYGEKSGWSIRAGSTGIVAGLGW